MNSAFANDFRFNRFQLYPHVLGWHINTLQEVHIVEDKVIALKLALNVPSICPNETVYKAPRDVLDSLIAHSPI